VATRKGTGVDRGKREGAWEGAGSGGDQPVTASGPGSLGITRRGSPRASPSAGGPHLASSELTR
jgi:hypothetical protein